MNKLLLVGILLVNLVFVFAGSLFAEQPFPLIWTQTSNPSYIGDRTEGVAVDSTGIYAEFF